MTTEIRPWGRFTILHADHETWLKRLIIAPGQSLSYQYHNKRSEFWWVRDEGLEITIGERTTLAKKGQMFTVGPRVRHRIKNTGQADALVIEWALGQPDEADIVRLEDDYGRVT